MVKARTLTPKEQAFVLAYTGKCRGNGTRAMLEAGYKYTPASAGAEAHKALKKPHIRQAIDAIADAKAKKLIADADERDAILTAIARKPKLNAGDRIAAVKELNKCSGRHSLRHFHDGKLTLEQVLTESRK